MAHYAIGDLQGCFEPLQRLLAQIGFSHSRDTLWLTGDLINRGPQSLECLQFCMAHESSVQTVLGNHDLHLLALMHGHGRIKRGDTIAGLLTHPEAERIKNWLLRQPLLRRHQNYLLVHAGLLPQWTAQQAAALAAEVETVLQSDRADAFFARMYGNLPDSWHNNLQGFDRLRLITNIFTRMRALTFDNTPDYGFKGTLADMPGHLRAWFEAPGRRHTDHTVVFGHWSALGYLDDKHVIALDTGAVWGGRLTAVDLSDRTISQVPGLPKNPAAKAV
ncbi:symmetrical bis(5'-nucleosyl)-tetraphosphatase [Neisseria leonii]|uniref:bis(5'-nucleosyl)-tetraphosphatase (symmetrical) n=1 Tax=Neisseria leonii TaxID=2995413 RepID=A0A9X4E0Z6_9NEIS|nr:symmetrical bis(5'-nucleosyl)-tetraphosphatase [Neisseria sp. 51.81]MDD9326809.1 symmetrical bis(5'-nucleosyl)-tetraphosphatase [Neisseria sp. 51.81]